MTSQDAWVFLGRLRGLGMSWEAQGDGRANVAWLGDQGTSVLGSALPDRGEGRTRGGRLRD